MRFDGVSRVNRREAGRHWWMRLLLVATGFLAGAAIALITRLAGGSGLVLGSYRFAQEGALIFPGLLVPYALFWGWTLALRRGAQPRDLALFAAGIHFGVGLISNTLLGFLIAGFIFVDASSAFAAAGLYWARRVEPRTILITLVVAVAASFALVVIYHLVLAVAAGTAVAFLERKTPRTLLVAAGLGVLVCLLAIVPITASPAV